MILRPTLIASILACLLFITSCNPAEKSDVLGKPQDTFLQIQESSNIYNENTGGKHGGVLTLANRGDPPAGFDSLRTSSIALHHIGGALFGPSNLVRRCRQDFYKICPNLAEKWTVDQSHKEWTFTIRQDVYWHDETNVTPEDIKFWFDMAYHGTNISDEYRPPAYFKSELGHIENISILDEHRIQFRLLDRNPYFLDILANPRFKIAHAKHLTIPHLIEGNTSITPIEMGLVGLGPFKLNRYNRGSLIRLDKWGNYWEKSENGPLPYLDRIDYVIMPDPFAMDIAFRTGKLDGGARGQSHYLTTERKAGYEKALPGQVFFSETDGGNFRLAFNVLNEGPWQNQDVRRAIALWIDKQSAIDSVLGGFGWTTPDLSPPNIVMPIGRSNLINWPKFDRDSLEIKRKEAKRLLESSGYGQGFNMGHLCRSINPVPCEYLQSQLNGLNINLKLNIVEEGQWNKARGSLEYDSQQGRLTPSPIPEGTESVYGRYSKSPDAYAKHEDMELDRMYNLLRDASQPDRRAEIWRGIEEYLYLEQTYIVPIAESINVIPYRTHVRDLPIPPEDTHSYTDFTTVWLEPSAR